MCGGGGGCRDGSGEAAGDGVRSQDAAGGPLRGGVQGAGVVRARGRGAAGERAPQGDLHQGDQARHGQRQQHRRHLRLQLLGALQVRQPGEAHLLHPQVLPAVRHAQGPGGPEEEGPAGASGRRPRRAQGVRARLRLRRVQRPGRPGQEPRPPAARAGRQQAVPVPAPLPHRSPQDQEGPRGGGAPWAQLRAPRRAVLGGQAAHVRGHDAALGPARAAPGHQADAHQEGAALPALPGHRRPLQRRHPAAGADRVGRHPQHRPARGQAGGGHHRARPPLRAAGHDRERPLLVVQRRGVREADDRGAQPAVHPAPDGVPHQEQAGPGGVRPGGVRHHQGDPGEAHERRRRHDRGAGARGEASVHPGLPRRVPALRAQGARAAGHDALRLPHRLLPHGPGHADAAGHRAGAAQIADAAAVEAGVHARARRHRRLAVEACQGARGDPRHGVPPAGEPLAAHALLRGALHHCREPAAQPAAPGVPPPAPALPLHHGDQRAGQGGAHQRRRHHRGVLLAGQVRRRAQLSGVRRHVAVRHGGAAQRPRQAWARRAPGRRRAGAHHQGLPLRARRAHGLEHHKAVGGRLRQRLLQVRRGRRRRPRAEGVLGRGAQRGPRRQEGRAVVARARHPRQPRGDAHHHHVGHLRPPLGGQLRAVPLRRILPEPPDHHPEEHARGGGGGPGRRDEEVPEAAGDDPAGHAADADAGHQGDDDAGHPLVALARRGVHGRVGGAVVAGGAHGEGGVREVRRQDEGDRGIHRRVQQQPGAQEPVRSRDRAVRTAQALLQAGSHREGHPQQHLHLTRPSSPSNGGLPYCVHAS
uniref:Uncharacterized protein n=1 Tax=Zea mays TaxID=4577 RepID=A0A804PG79_MAIZE